MNKRDRQRLEEDAAHHDRKAAEAYREAEKYPDGYTKGRRITEALDEEAMAHNAREKIRGGTNFLPVDNEENWGRKYYGHG